MAAGNVQRKSGEVWTCIVPAKWTERRSYRALASPAVGHWGTCPPTRFLTVVFILSYFYHRPTSLFHIHSMHAYIADSVLRVDFVLHVLYSVHEHTCS